MRSAGWLGLVLLGGLWALSSAAVAALWQTADGLAVALSDRTGQVESVTVGDRNLKLSSGGGLACREYTRDPSVPARIVLRLGAEGAAKTWTPASFADWQASGDFVRRVNGATPEGEAYLQLGDGQSVGVGMAATEPFAVPAGGDCTVSWWSRTHDPALSYILCMRLFDAAGQDITATAPAPTGWAYSPYSQAHYRSDLSNTTADTWERLSCTYSLPEGAATARLSLRVYRGGDLRADLDDLQVAVAAGHWSDWVAVSSKLERTPEGLRQRATASAAGLRFTTVYQGETGQLRATVTVAETAPRPRGRCLQLRYRVPLALTGWSAAVAPDRAEPITATSRHGAEASLAGHRLSRYPLLAVGQGATGLALAVALDQPALQSFTADANGLTTTVDLGLAAQAPRAPGQFTFSLYRHDPTWAFRAALERYYALFPALFTPATTRGGAWTLRLPRPADAAPEDFGLAFYECNNLPPEKREFCRTHGLMTLVYSEPWGRRQVFPQAKSQAEMPPYDQRLAQLQEWAGDQAPGATWNGAPRAEVARAVLNSLLVGPDGRAAHLVDLYSTWAQWWQLNTDPDLPRPNIASICRQYEITPALEWADGIYLDSVSFGLGVFEDHTPGHLAAANRPLAFSPQTGDPVVLSSFAAYEFMQGLRDDLHGRGKLLMLNLFPPATRLYGHLADVAGCEVAGPQDLAEACEQRVYAYHRPVSNLLQWRFAVLQRVPAMTAAEMEDYLANQLAYGFWPGISTAGGGTEPGYQHMHRYLEDAGLLARDRPLFARYLPVFDALNHAGWEPVPHARADAAEVRVERFGQGTGALLTLANPGPEPRTVRLALDPGWWTQALGRKGPLTLRSLLTEEEYRTDAAGLVASVTVPERRTLVLRVAGQ